MTSFLAVASAKGGVGKTTTAIQLAKAFAYLQHSVLLIDLHLHKPNVGVFLKVSGDKNVHTALSKHHHISEAMQEYETIQIIPGSEDEELLHYEFTTQDIEYVFSNLVSRVDIVIIDTPSGLSRETKTVLKACDNVVLVTTGDEAAIQDTNRTSNWLKKINKSVVGVIVNKQTTGLKQIQEQLTDSIIGSVPTIKNLDVEHPVYRSIAANLIGQKYEYTQPSNILSYIGQRLHLMKK